MSFARLGRPRSAITAPRQPDGPEAPSVRATGLTVNFGAIQVLRGVDLTVPRGELLAIAGENGAGKSTLLRCLVGDLTPSGGQVLLDGRRVGAFRRTVRRPTVGIVWQTAAQCDNLDVASNLLLGHERRGVMYSESHRHAVAAGLLHRLGLPAIDTSQPMRSVPRSKRQLVAIAHAVATRPAVLMLDEPTGPLGASDAAVVERLITRLNRQGCTVVMVSHDISQMMRLADRLIVLRRGAVAGEVDPASAHVDDIAAMMAGRQVESSARRQLVRLQDLVDRLASADPSSGLPLILTALGAALGADRLCFHRTDGSQLTLVWSLGIPAAEQQALATVPFGERGGPAGIAAASGEPSVDLDGHHRSLAGWPEVAAAAGRPRACYAVPVVGSAESLGVITVFHSDPGAPADDELDLVGLYAGYVAGAVERQAAEVARQEAATALRGQEQQRQFLSRLSHELRTPLTAIRGYASSLAQPDVAWDDASQHRFLTHISVESDRLGRLVGDLLDFSAIESGLLRLNRDWCDVALVIEAARACLPLAAADRVAVDCAARLPVIWADHDRLEQVLVNLTDNAVRHNPPATRVWVEARPNANGVRIAVTDDGLGLPPGSVTVAEPVRHRASTSGSGLGMSIARGIVEAHGGRLRREPVPRGTRLCVDLPETPTSDMAAEGWSAERPDREAT